MVIGEEESENPRSLLVERVSEKVFITVRKMATLRGLPWYTPIPRGIGVMHHSSVETVADKPVYSDCMRAQTQEEHGNGRDRIESANGGHCRTHWQCPARL